VLKTIYTETMIYILFRLFDEKNSIYLKQKYFVSLSLIVNLICAEQKYKVLTDIYYLKLHYFDLLY